MASAKKCDRCKNYYDKNEGVISINGCSVVGINIINNRAEYDVIDLCDDCISKLYNFLNMEVKEDAEN